MSKNVCVCVPEPFLAPGSPPPPAFQLTSQGGKTRLWRRRAKEPAAKGKRENSEIGITVLPCLRPGFDFQTHLLVSTISRGWLTKSHLLQQTPKVKLPAGAVCQLPASFTARTPGLMYLPYSAWVSFKGKRVAERNLSCLETI